MNSAGKELNDRGLKLRIMTTGARTPRTHSATKILVERERGVVRSVA